MAEGGTPNRRTPCLPTVLGLRAGNGLPLHVGNCVGAAAGERDDVILPIAGTSAGGFAGRRAGMVPLKFPRHFTVAQEPLLRLQGALGVRRMRRPVTKIGFAASLPALTKGEPLFDLGAGSNSHLRLDRSARLSRKGCGGAPGSSSRGFA